MKSLITFLFVFSMACAYAEKEGDLKEPKSYSATQYYDILLGNNKIGDFVIERFEESETITYKAKSDVAVRIFKDFSFAYTLHCVYERERLTYSKYVFYRNGQIIDSTIVVWQGKDYLITKNDEVFRFKEPVYHSAVQLYFKQPSEKGIVFSEKEGEFMDIQHNEWQLYKLMAEDKGRVIDYIYQSDMLKEVVVDLTITEFKMERQQVEFTYP